MPDAPASFADPALVSRIGDLELIARRIVDGLVSGLHRSPFHGYSAEFSQYRHYQRGDDLKHVDWKLFARTDRLYTKQFRETTNLGACLVMDASRSMAFAGRGPLSKLRYAAILAAVLGHLIARQGDQIGLLAEGGGRADYVKARGGTLHLRTVMHALARLEGHGRWDGAESIRRADDLLGRRGLLLVFSDFYDASPESLTVLRRAVRRGHEVALFQVITRDEIDLPYDGVLDLEDLETADHREVDIGATRAGYRDRMAEFLERIRGAARSDGLDYSLVVTDQPIDETLRRYLVQQRAVEGTA